jgi:hypothetical protein
VAFAAKTLGFFGDDACDAFEAYAASLHEGAEPKGLFTRPVAFGIASDGATRVLDARASLGLDPLPPTRGPSPAIAASRRRRRPKSAVATRQKGGRRRSARRSGDARDDFLTTMQLTKKAFFSLSTDRDFGVSRKVRIVPAHPPNRGDFPREERRPRER